MQGRRKKSDSHLWVAKECTGNFYVSNLFEIASNGSFEIALGLELKEKEEEEICSNLLELAQTLKHSCSRLRLLWLRCVWGMIGRQATNDDDLYSWIDALSEGKSNGMKVDAETGDGVSARCGSSYVTSLGRIPRAVGFKRRMLYGSCGGIVA